MPSSPCANAPAIAVPSSATWMPPEPPPPATDLPTIDAAPYRGARDQHGRFLKGNPGGPGNPNARRAAALRKALCEAVTAEDMYKVGKVMLQKALEGDVQAAKFLASYVMGRPMSAPDSDRLDLEELKIYTDEAAASAGVTAALNGMAAGMSCFFISSVRPAKMHQFLGTMGQALETGTVPDTMGQGPDPDTGCDPVGQGTAPEAGTSCQGQGPDPRTTGPSVANGANGGPAPAEVPPPSQPAPSSIGDNGPATPAAAATPAPRPAATAPVRPPIPGWPGVGPISGPPPSANRDNGPSRHKRRRK